jgi:hypothetical protein
MLRLMGLWVLLTVGCALVTVQTPGGTTCRAVTVLQAKVTCCETGAAGAMPCTTIESSEPTHVSAVLTALGGLAAIVIPLVL